MLDFEVQRCTRRCAKTGKALEPGENFYSVLVAQGGNVLRFDYSEKGWDGPPEDCLGWWKSQMPSPDARKIHWAPNDVMLHYFQQLEAEPEKADVRYLLALLMIRRRVVRLEETETDPQGRETLVLYCPRNEDEYRVPVVDLDEARIDQVQNELVRLLFAEAT